MRQTEVHAPASGRRISRARLLDRLDAASPHGGAVIIATPPGSGVTSLLEAWRRHVAGLAGRAPVRIVDATGACSHEDLAERPAVGPDEAEVPPTLGAVLEAGEPVSLAFDGVPAPLFDVPSGVASQVRRVRHVERVVVAGGRSRADAARLATVLTTETVLTERDLWFDLDELRALAAARGVADADDDLVRPMHELTLGWPAAVIACATERDWPARPLAVSRDRLGLRACPPAGRALVERLLGPEADDVADLVGRLVAFPWVDAARLAAVTGEPGDAHLERLLTEVALVAPDVGAPGTWAPHPMLAAAAARRLRRQAPDRWAEALLRSAARYVDEGDLGAAIGCLHESGRVAELVRLVVEHFLDLAESGQVERVLAILGEAPRDEVASVPFGVLTFGLLHRFVGDERGAQAVWTELYSDRIDGGTPLYEASMTVATLMAMGVAYGIEPAEVVAAADVALDRFGAHRRSGLLATEIVEAPTPDALWSIPWHLDPTTVLAYVHASRAEAELLLGRNRDALDTIADGRRATNRDPRTVAILDAVEAAVHAGDGSLTRAHALASRAADALGRLVPFAPTVDARLSLAEVHLARGDRDEALALAAAAEADARAIGAVTRLVQVELIRADAALAAGQPLRALHTLRDLDVASLAVGDQRAARRILTTTVAAHLARGDLSTAHAELSRTRIAAIDVPEAHAALAVAAEDRGALRRIVDAWPSSSSPLRRARWAAMRGHLARLQGDRDAASASAALVADLVFAEGFLQPLLDLGVDLAGLLADAADTPTVVALRLALDERDEVTRSSQVRLSNRELQVLRGIADHRTDEQLVEELGVSRNTLKTFRRRLYGKLKASSQGEAVRRAEELGILAPRSVRGHRR